MLCIKRKIQNEGLEGEEPMIPCHTALGIPPKLFLLKKLAFFPLLQYVKNYD